MAFPGYLHLYFSVFQVNAFKVGSTMNIHMVCFPMGIFCASYSSECFSPDSLSTELDMLCSSSNVDVIKSLNFSGPDQLTRHLFLDIVRIYCSQ